VLRRGSLGLISFHSPHLQIIPIVDGALQEAFNVRLDELKVLDLAFLHGCDVPTLAVLFEDTKEQRHIKTYRVSVKDKVSRGLRAPPGKNIFSRLIFKHLYFLVIEY
jgi:hypothetical protein